MSQLDTLLAHYAESHRDPRNETIHLICVPVILFAVLGVLYGITPLLALIGIAAALMYYTKLGSRPALEMAATLIVMLLVWKLLIPVHRIPIAIALFVVAWIGQFIGHGYEGKKPSFFEDVQYLLVGPLFVIDVLRKRSKARGSFL